MPTVAVYVPAARWRELSARAGDPAERVRAHVRDWLDREHADDDRRAALAVPFAGREHFRPDPKPPQRRGARA